MAKLLAKRRTELINYMTNIASIVPTEAEESLRIGHDLVRHSQVSSMGNRSQEVHA